MRYTGIMEKELQNKNDREPQFSEFFDELKNDLDARDITYSEESLVQGKWEHYEEGCNIQELQDRIQGRGTKWRIAEDEDTKSRNTRYSNSAYGWKVHGNDAIRKDFREGNKYHIFYAGEYEGETNVPMIFVMTNRDGTVTSIKIKGENSNIGMDLIGNIKDFLSGYQVEDTLRRNVMYTS